MPPRHDARHLHVKYRLFVAVLVLRLEHLHFRLLASLLGLVKEVHRALVNCAILLALPQLFVDIVSVDLLSAICSVDLCFVLPDLLLAAIVLPLEMRAHAAVQNLVEEDVGSTGAADLDLLIAEPLLAAKHGGASQIANREHSKGFEWVVRVLIQHSRIIVVVMVEYGQTSDRDHQEHEAELQQNIKVGIDAVAQF